MNDNFVPQTVEVVQEVAKPVEMTDDMKASIKLAEVTSNQEVLNIIRLSAMWAQAIKSDARIPNDEAYANAINLFTKVKATAKDWESLLQSYIGFPNKFVKMCRDVFRPVATSLEERKKIISAAISAYDNAKQKLIEEEKARQEAEAAKSIPVQNGESAGEMVPVPQGPVKVSEAAPTMRTTANGGKVQMREFLDCEVVDAMELLKAIISKSPRNAAYTEELVNFNMAKIRELCTGKRKIPGVEWKRERRAV